MSRNQSAAKISVYDDGKLRIEYENYYVSCCGNRIKVPKVEFQVLSRLSESPDRVVGYEDLWKTVWGDSKPYSFESLRVYVYRLRHRFIKCGIQFESMVGVGYRFIPSR